MAASALWVVWIIVVFVSVAIWTDRNPSHFGELVAKLGVASRMKPEDIMHHKHAAFHLRPGRWRYAVALNSVAGTGTDGLEGATPKAHVWCGLRWVCPIGTAGSWLAARRGLDGRIEQQRRSGICLRHRKEGRARRDGAASLSPDRLASCLSYFLL